MMNVKGALVLLVTAVATAGCDDDRSCEALCARQATCMGITGPPDACEASCLRDIELVAKEGCRDALRGLVECAADPELSCDDFTAWQSDPATVPEFCAAERATLARADVCPPSAE